MGLNQNWDNSKLLFGCGENYEKIYLETAKLNNDLQSLLKEIDTQTDVKALFKRAQELSTILREGNTLSLGLSSDDVNDTHAMALSNTFTKLNSLFEGVEVKLNCRLAKLSDEEFDTLCTDEKITPIAPVLKRRRDWVKEMLPEEKELLISDLAVDGLSAWEQVYYSYLGEQKFTLDGDEYSYSSLEQKFCHGDKKVRDAAFEVLEEVLSEKETIFAQIQGSIVGFRLSTYQKRGWTSPLKETLHQNKLKETSLRAMWDQVEKIKPKLKLYLEKKAELLGLEQLGWQDLDAPLGKEQSFTYDRACQFIYDQFSSYSPKMAEFAKMAVDNRWVEVEMRKCKRGGGYCSDAPLAKESRIFMNWTGTITNLMTLAHELGHAFHTWVLKDEKELAQHYSMNVAEMASTAAEAIVSTAALKATDDKDEKLFLLAEQLDRAVAFCMNIHARFIYEENLCLQRKLNPLDAKSLNQMMIDAQKKGYNDALSSYHPHFWCSKMHFNFTDLAFYNYPYTMGYLFSLGVLEATQDNFEAPYIALLKDTGVLSTEELIQTHLQMDISKPEFWQGATAPISRLVDEFILLLP
ncbi:MAG: hypothetical protein S4CHLAM102_07270 [Chlamydiia bacterium]|nr:hypothetical protein [Chlamydiia bacterium]